MVALIFAVSPETWVFLLLAYYPIREGKFQKFLLGFYYHKSLNFLDQEANVGVLLIAEYVCYLLKNQEIKHREGCYKTVLDPIYHQTSISSFLPVDCCGILDL